MTEEIQKLEHLKNQALTSLYKISEANALEEWRVKYLGRNGAVAAIIRQIPSVPKEQRAALGAAANKTKQELALEFDKHAESMKNEQPVDAIDITLPGRKPRKGGFHPSTRTIREILKAFNQMGFQTVEGTEIERERYNFDLLNIPKEHPARDLWDTIWIESSSPKGFLLRTHTSPMQARIMERQEPPVRVVVPGKCYRHEATDPTHEWQFHQIEGLAVGEGITFAHLKGTLYEFARRLFGAERKVRFRCDFFPFVEPGVDMSIDCFLCMGAGCRVCANSGWIEILGAGMVHPKVLRDVGYNPRKVTGFAFGMGPERIALLRHRIEDIRAFFHNDLRFLNQFHQGV